MQTSEWNNEAVLQVFETLQHARRDCTAGLEVESFGTVQFVGAGITRISGMRGVQSEELIRFPQGSLAMAFNIDPDQIGAVLLDEGEGLAAGDEAYRTGQVASIPVGNGLLGWIIDGRGRPLDGGPALQTSETRPIERSAPQIMDRAPVTVPLQTGLKVIDALIPIGRGQRELILGDRQTGKTAIALDTVINQKDRSVICIYCAVGKRNSDVAKVIDDFRRHEAMSYSLVIVATEEDPPGLQFIAPYAAMTAAEHFMDLGGDVLVIFDDLTRHARAYRELSLLLRRPPGREAYPGDIFYIHSRLLERSTHLKEEHGGGSVTALPVIETEAENISAYIPTNLISITDGQIYLSPRLFRKGNLPAVDVGKSVSRVGGKTQLDAYRAVAGDLRLAYSQFEELEAFSRFGTRMDEETRKTLERGRRVREILKQPQFQPLSAAEQIVSLVTVNEGLLDGVELDAVADLEAEIRSAAVESLAEICRDIENGKSLTDKDLGRIRELAAEVIDRNTQPDSAPGNEESSH
ncbi:MAG TPA: alternate F1F0 ATPase, F1 subunit alpha [Desulfobacterales bacterium]